MKGVILGIHPGARIVDITHGIPPGNIMAGAFALAAAAPFFPDDTIHVAVVDPGVGGDRDPVAVLTGRGIFVGPDNGVLSRAVESAGIREIRVLSDPRFRLSEVSGTFHGRDVFAPVAGHLARGTSFADIGPILPGLKGIVRLPPIRCSRSHIEGAVIYIDRFGNAITNISGDDLQPTWDHPPRFRVGASLVRTAPFYAEAPPGAPVAVPGSSGYWEIAVHGGSAAERFGLEVNSPVRAERVARAADRE